MRRGFDYTSRALAYSLRYPRLTYTSIQITFWTVAYLLLSIILNLSARGFTASADTSIQPPFLTSVVISVVSGILYGGASGVVGFLLGEKFLKGRSLGLIIVIQAAALYIVLLMMLSLVRFVLWESMVVPYAFGGVSPLDDVAWRYFYYVALIYTLLMTLVITFINQMNSQFGPGVLIPLLLGKYRTPREEERVFIFMDMTSSTTHAEKLGHLRYSALVRDCFLDINRVLSRHHAEIYQYVGDEIVLSWSLADGLSNHTCVEFYFACQQRLNERRSYYMATYGFVPEFKAGLHLGVVTAVEVGEVKRNIAYHGDTLNTTSRIRSLCGHYGKDLLISEDIRVAAARLDETYNVNSLGQVQLRGKDQPVEIFSVDK